MDSGCFAQCIELPEQGNAARCLFQTCHIEINLFGPEHCEQDEEMTSVLC